MIEGEPGGAPAVRLLGPVEVEIGGRVVPLPSRVERGVVASLALRVGYPVTIEAVYGDVWGTEQAPSWRKGVHVAISRLRDRIQAAGGSGGVIETSDDGYRLALPRDAIDIGRFDDCYAEGRTLLRGGDAAGAEHALDRALGLWRGEPLQELADSTAGQAEAARLGELRQAALEAWADAALALGRHDDLVARLEAGLVEEPLRERRWAQLMLALYLAGRQGDALRAFQRARAVLGDRLGLEPGPELRRVEAAILDHEPGLGPDFLRSGREGEPRVPMSRPASSDGVVAPMEWVARQREVPLSGRDAALMEVSQAWRRARQEPASGLVFVTGPAGSGKTRLAAELAAAAHDEGALVLAGRCIPGGGLSALVAAAAPLGLDVPQGDLSPGSPILFEHLAAVYEHLRAIAVRRPVLVVLDDAQWADAQLVAAFQAQADRPLPRPDPVPYLGLVLYRDDRALPNGGARLVGATDRLAIHEVVRLGPLTSAEATDLFVHRLGSTAEGLEPLTIDTVVNFAAGNPGYLLGLADHTRRVAEHDPRLLSAGAGLSIEALGVPPALHQTVFDRLEPLPQAVVRVLLAAAVVGLEFSLGAVCAVASVDEDDALDALESALAVEIIRERDEGQYAFVCPLERQVLLDRLSATRRATLTERLARVA